jgi:hypothetical protein
MQGWNGDVYFSYLLYFALTLKYECDVGNDDGNVIRDTPTFASSFFQKVLNENVQHVKTHWS